MPFVSLPFLNLIAAVTLAAQAPQVALAQLPSGSTQDDLRCIAVISTIVGAQKEKADPAMFAGFLYFLGRIEGREPGYDVEANLVTLLSRPDADTILKANAERCGNVLIDRGNFISSMGDRLQRK